MTSVKALALAAALALTSTALAQRVIPRDEAPQDPDFHQFRDLLLEAVRNRDRDYLVAVLAPQIQCSFGESGGVAGFLAAWNLDDPACRLWDELGAVLAMGGQFKRQEGVKSFYAPFTFTAALPTDYDPYETLIVLAATTPLLAEPRPDAPRVTWLSRNVLRVVREPAQHLRVGDYTHVELSDGRRGFALSAALRSPIDYRACFQKIQGRWMLTAFVSGD